MSNLCLGDAGGPNGAVDLKLSNPPFFVINPAPWQESVERFDPLIPWAQ
jgi:hypothetical protein